MVNLIDRTKLARVVNTRTLGTTDPYSDEAAMSIIKIRDVANANDVALDISVDVLGCDIRCDHCFVSNASLAADYSHPSIQSKLKKLPKAFRQARSSATELAAYLHTKLAKSAKQHEGSGVSFSGGEPLPYRGGIKAIAEYFQTQPEPFYVNVETHGELIALDETYLDAFEGLQDTLRFYVSIKATDDKNFARFTGAKQGRDDAFIALERLLKRGFLATPGGVVLDCFEAPENLNAEDNAITRLHTRLSEIHPDLPRAIAYHSVTKGQVQAPQEQEARMRKSGYWDLRPKPVQQALLAHFAARGTPVIMADNTTKVKGAEYQRTATLLKDIIADLQQKGRKKTRTRERALV
ncbi:MAG: radical SAM protein [Alphaproteobacteria bacterium]|nr:radical SAM protein [Alphaproteobacteria bacterium]